MTVAIIGIGLIGGSMALALRNAGIADYVIGVDNNAAHAERALELQLVNEMTDLQTAVDKAELIILAVPVNAAHALIPGILDKVSTQVVMDVGSTKAGILDAIRTHDKRGRFVATHPMWGTEFSGPDAAVKEAFINKAVVITDAGDTDEDALKLVTEMYERIGMHILHMESEAHDLHAAYVSHISHITSFALANTVLEKEREEDTIFQMASGGFESTVRLAKSNAAMWVPIFMQNRENVLDVLNEHIAQLRKFKSCLEKENFTYLRELIENANRITRILK